MEQSYRLITDLVDLALFPALLLAHQDHQRWEAETTLDEFKTHLNGRKVPIRSKNPREVIQAVYGWLLGHWVIRCLMFQAAQQNHLSPLTAQLYQQFTVGATGNSPISSGSTSRSPFFGSGLMQELLRL